MDQVYLRESRILKRLAQDVFGKDLVVNAWVAETGDDLQEVEISLQEGEDFISVVSSARTGMHYDTHTVWVQFSNGSTVQFHASEWASMKRVDIESAQTL